MRMTPEQKAFYAEHGYVHFRGLLSPEEAADYRARIHALAERQGETDATWDSVKGDTQIQHSHDIHFRDAAFIGALLDEDPLGPRALRRRQEHMRDFFRAALAP